MINSRLEIGDGNIVDVFTEFGFIYVGSDNRFEAPTKGFTSTTYVNEPGEHIDPRSMPAAFDYKVKFLVMAPNNSLENANEKIAAFNKALYDVVDGVRTYKQVAFYNDYKRVKIVGYPNPISEATEFWRDNKQKQHDCVQFEWTIRVSDPTLCDFNTKPGKTLRVTTPNDSVNLTINNKTKTYSVTPNEPSEVFVEGGVTNLSTMCKGQNITSLDLSNLDTSKVLNISIICYNCNALTSVNFKGFNSSSLNNMARMFYGCQKLSAVDLSMLDTSKVGDFDRIFYNCRAITTIDISSFDMGAATDVTYMFVSCMSLTDLKFGHNLKISIDLHWSPILTHESALSVLNGLAEVTTTQTVTFSASTYNTLTNEDIALATEKGWSVVSA